MLGFLCTMYIFCGFMNKEARLLDHSVCIGSHQSHTIALGAYPPLHPWKLLWLLPWPLQHGYIVASPPRSLKHRPWKMVVGRLLSYWEGNFSGVYVLRQEEPTSKMCIFTHWEGNFSGVYVLRQEEPTSKMCIFTHVFSMQLDLALPFPKKPDSNPPPTEHTVGKTREMCITCV